MIISFLVFVAIAATSDDQTADNWRVGGVVTLVVTFLILFVVLPQIRGGNAAQREADEQAKEHAENVKRAKQWQDEQEAKEAAIAAASEEEIRALVVECQSKIKKELTERSLAFEPYFAHYESGVLDTLGSMARVTGGTLGQPSGALDDYEFDPVAHNVEQIMRDKYPSRSVVFVVEHAMDSFSGIKRYVTTYRCDLDGLNSLGSPSRGEVYFLD